MLNQRYVSRRPCCTQLKFKNQLRDIQIVNDPSAYPLNTAQKLGYPNEQNNMYKKGRWYQSMDISFCTIIPCLCCPCPVPSYEFQIDGQIATQTNLPFCCPCLGPYPVKHKDIPIGQLRPQWYICHYMVYNIFHPCCSKLNVYNNTQQHIYTIQRIPFTCFCCTEWNVLDLSQQIKGNIKTGGCCFPYYDITLPMDREQHKQLILGSFGVLP